MAPAAIIIVLISGDGPRDGRARRRLHTHVPPQRAAPAPAYRAAADRRARDRSPTPAETACYAQFVAHVSTYKDTASTAVFYKRSAKKKCDDPTDRPSNFSGLTVEFRGEMQLLMNWFFEKCFRLSHVDMSRKSV